MDEDQDPILVVVARIETKLDAALSRVEDHEDRIRRLERALWVAVGIAAASGGTIGAVATSIIQKG